MSWRENLKFKKETQTTSQFVCDSFPWASLNILFFYYSPSNISKAHL